MDQIEEVKQKTDLVSLVSEMVTLKKAGRNFKGLCPFHNEKTPSMMVSPERQIWKCFGCGEGGDVFKFVMRAEGVEFGEALRILAKKAGVKLEERAFSPEGKKKKLYWEINHLAAEFYHYLLMKHPLGKRAKDYILGRGITIESLEEFKIGFSPNLYEGLQKFLVGKKGYAARDLLAAGLVGEKQRGGFYDRFRGRLMFPLFDQRSNLCGFAGRIIPGVTSEQNLMGKYINSPETEIYHKSEMLFGFNLTKREIQKQDQAVVVEGELDAISSYQAGVANVVAIKGSALTEGQLRLLGRFTKNLVLGLDADFAGNEAAKRGIGLAERQGFSIRAVKIEGGKDPDEIAQGKPELWKKMVAEAVPVFDFLMYLSFKKHGGETGEEKRKIGQELVPVLAKFEDAILQAHYMMELGRRLGVGEEAVISMVEREKKQGGIEKKTIFFQKTEEEKKSRREVIEEYLMALCLQTKNWEKLVLLAEEEVWRIPRLLELARALGRFLDEGKERETSVLAAWLPAELRGILDELFLYELHGELTDEELIEIEIERKRRDLQMIGLREKLGKIAGEIGRGEQLGEGVGKLTKKIKELSDDLVALDKKAVGLRKSQEVLK